MPPSALNKYPIRNDRPFEPNDTLKLDDNIIVAMQKIQRIHELMEKLPGYDCGSCGSPTCETFAEDIVNGQCREMDCIHLMKAEIQRMAQEMVDLAQTKRE